MYFVYEFMNSVHIINDLLTETVWPQFFSSIIAAVCEHDRQRCTTQGQPHKIFGNSVPLPTRPFQDKAILYFRPSREEDTVYRIFSPKVWPCRCILPLIVAMLPTFCSCHSSTSSSNKFHSRLPGYVNIFELFINIGKFIIFSLYNGWNIDSLSRIISDAGGRVRFIK
jgi:hypothetical protein